jgi:hypothetical protein
MDVDRKTLQIVFDVAVNSLDFGSGFLDQEEVDALRDLAKALDVDPMMATPHNLRCVYTGKHEPWPSSEGAAMNRFAIDPRMCRYCHKIV